jgi:Na+/H+-translocating membrane pyrophosphatase
MVIPDFLAIPVPPLVYLVPKEFSKLLIGFVKIYCALLMDNSGETHDNVKND